MSPKQQGRAIKGFSHIVIQFNFPPLLSLNFEQEQKPKAGKRRLA